MLRLSKPWTSGDRVLNDKAGRVDGRLYLSQFDDLIRRLDAVDVRIPEDSALIGMANDLVPMVTNVLRQAMALMVSVEKAFKQARSTGVRKDGPPEDESLRAIAALIATETAERELVDLSYFAQIELQQAIDALQRALAYRDPVLVASACESSLRRARHSLVSLESTIHEYEEIEPPARHFVDLEMSLQIRRLYRNLREDILARRRGDASVPETLLRRVLYRLIAFRELRIYPFLRVDDRVNLRELLRRIVEWLNTDVRDPSEAGRLWESLLDFAQVLAQVSYRQELREHDLRLVARARELLFPGGVASPRVPEALAAELHALLGLDDALDRLVLEPDAAPVEAWREPLERQARRLEGGQSSTSIPAEFIVAG